jgi:hypothetical protein
LRLGLVYNLFKLLEIHFSFDHVWGCEGLLRDSQIFEEVRGLVIDCAVVFGKLAEKKSVNLEGFG